MPQTMVKRQRYGAIDGHSATNIVPSLMTANAVVHTTPHKCVHITREWITGSTTLVG